MNSTFLFSIALAGVALFAVVGIGFTFIAFSLRQEQKYDELQRNLLRAVSLAPRELRCCLRE
jgi:hypothetical protein